MHLRDELIVEYLSKGLCMGAIARELKLNRNIIRKTLIRLERQGQIIINKSTYPHSIKVVSVTPANGGYMVRGNTTSERGGNTAPIFGLRNFALKFSFEGQPPAWRKFKAGWRGGQAFHQYIRGARCEAYIGKARRTLVIYAYPDMEGDNPKLLEADAVEYCRRQAAYLSDKFGWRVGEQISVLGAVIPIKKGEYDYRPLAPYAEQLRKLGHTPIYGAHGKIDRSPKPAAFQIYTAEWAGRLLNMPLELDNINIQLVKQVEALGKIEKITGLIIKRLDDMEVR